jgi:hypothetical protein
MKEARLRRIHIGFHLHDAEDKIIGAENTSVTASGR